MIPGIKTIYQFEKKSCLSDKVKKEKKNFEEHIYRSWILTVRNTTETYFV